MGGLWMTVLDVGQGLAVVVQVQVSGQHKTLVYDTGPSSGDRFNAGDAIVAPYLKTQGIKRIDKLVVSHSDNDHAGGATALLKAFPVKQFIVGEALAFDHDDVRQTDCNQLPDWQWEDVRFQFLFNPISELARSAQQNVKARINNNNQSCVLVIRYHDQTILIPGDIESPVEHSLLQDPALPSDITLLIAPHHGSNTSSTNAFVAQLHPQTVVFSAGYRSRYGHPHPLVQTRYREIGSRAYTTAETGQLQFVWDGEGRLRVSAMRFDQPRYWF